MCPLRIIEFVLTSLFLISLITLAVVTTVKVIVIKKNKKGD